MDNKLIEKTSTKIVASIPEKPSLKITSKL